MVKINKIFSRTGKSQLVIGLIAISICFGVIIYGFGFLAGEEVDNQVVINRPLESYSISLLGLMLFPFLLGVYGGIEVGGYFQKISQKNSNQKT
jgi:hypothetical protein